MKTTIKAVCFSLSLFCCTDALLAQFPKINVKDAVKDVKGSKDKVKGSTGNNTPEGRKEYAGLMAEGKKLNDSGKYLEAAAVFEKAVAKAPTQSEYSTSADETYKKDAEAALANAKKEHNDCITRRKKLDELAGAKSYEEALLYLRHFCEAPNPTNRRDQNCYCIMPSTEISKLETSFKQGVKDGEKALAEQRLKDEEAKEAAKYPQVPDNGVTGSLHKAHLNKIVFSKAPTTVNSPESALSNTFTLGDDIFFHVFLDKSPLNIIREARGDDGNAYNLGMEVYINGKVMISNYDGRERNSSTIVSCALQGFDTKTATDVVGSLSYKWGTYEHAREGLPLDFFYNAYLLPNGTHTVKIVFNEGGKRTAQGEFTLNVTDAGKAAIGKKACPLPAITANTKNYNRSLRIVPTATEMVKKELPAGTTLLKVVELDSDWSYEKNGFGIILKRTLAGQAFLKHNATGLYFTKSLTFTQENISSGGSKYGSTVWKWGHSGMNTDGFKYCKECLGK